MDVITTCSRPVNSIYPAVLWQVATTIAELLVKNAEVSRQTLLEGVEELMGLWRLSMQSLSQRSDLIASDMPVIADWSFLPDHTLFADGLQRRRRTGSDARFSFARALDLLVPEVTLNKRKGLHLMARMCTIIHQRQW